MLEVTPTVMVVVAIAGFLIGLSKAGLGGGIGPAITAIMVLVMPPATALGVLLPMLIVGDLLALTSLWGKWERRYLVILASGAFVGLAAGTYLVASISSGVIQTLIAIVSLAYVAYRLIAPRILKATEVVVPKWAGVVAGAAGGFASAVAHAGGPPVSIYLLMKKVEPIPYTATMLALFTIANLAKVPAYVAAGLFDWPLMLSLAPTLLVIPVGVVAGRWLLIRVSTVVFDRLITAILAFTGIYLLIR
jgi:uncharacterized membrane protein YfcA